MKKTINVKNSKTNVKPSKKKALSNSTKAKLNAAGKKHDYHPKTDSEESSEDNEAGNSTKKRGRVVEEDTSDKKSSKEPRVKIDEKEVGKALAGNIAADFDAEVKAKMSPNGRCYVIEWTYKKYNVTVLVFNNNKFFVKAILCENAIFNNCVRTILGAEDTRKFVRLAFLKELTEKALAVPYVPSNKEAVA